MKFVVENLLKLKFHDSVHPFQNSFQRKNSIKNRCRKRLDNKEEKCIDIMCVVYSLIINKST